VVRRRGRDLRYNIIRHAASAINVLGYDDLHSSQQTKRLLISHNLVYDVDKSRWGGTGDFVQLGAMPRDITIEHNTVFHSGMALRLYGGRPPTGGHEIEGVVLRDNTMRHNTDGIKSDGMNSGNPSIARFLPGALLERNVIAGAPPSQYPAGNFFPSVAEFESQFVDLRNENFSLVGGSSFGSASSRASPLGADLGTMQHLMNGGAGVPGEQPPIGAVDPEVDDPRSRRRPGGSYR